MVATAEPATQNYSLDLNEEQTTLKSWVHEFAENVIRPAAHEWDEREETPWPILEEAARVGIYGAQFMAHVQSDPTGLMLPIAIEEIFWGDGGIGMAIFGSALAVAAITGNGTMEQVVEWAPQCYGTPEKVQLGAFCVSEPDAGSDVAGMKTRAVYDQAKDEWVINGQKTWISNGGIANIHVVVASVDPTLGGRGQASFVVPPGTPGLRQGTKFKKMGIRASHTAEVYLDDVRVPGRCLLGGKEKLDRRLERAREGQRSGEQAALSTFEATRPAVGAMALGTGQASFVVPPGTPGLRQGTKFKKMGIRASHTAEVYLDDVRVPGRCLLGGKEKLDRRLERAREGQRSGEQAALSTFEATRPAVGAMALGTARASYEWALAYAKERKQFGKPIIENQAISFMLANMKTEIDAARLLVHRAAWMARTRHAFEAAEGSMSKFKASEVCVWATERAIQIAGGIGYVREAPLERWHRDSKVYTIFEGTSEIQQLVIARAISGMRLT